MTPLPSGPGPTTSTVVLDGGDRGCVRLLLELRALVADVAPGTVIHLRTTDPAAPLDLPAWCHLTGHSYLGPIPHRGAPTYGIRTHPVAGAGTDPGNPWRPTRHR